MLKRDFYQALNSNLRGKADISTESLKGGSQLTIYKLGHDKTSLIGNPFVNVVINHNVVDIYTYNNKTNHTTLVSSINWNKAFKANMVSLTQKEIEKQLTVI